MIGRSSRFVKLYGLRIDLQRVEAALQRRRRDGLLHRRRRASRGGRGRTADRADGVQRITVAAVRPARGRRSRSSRMARATAAAVGQAGLPADPRHRAADGRAGERRPIDLRALFADVLQIDPATIDPDQSFVDLGGNSLSYVTMSVRLERALGRLPADWQRLVAAPNWSACTVGASVVAVVGCDAGDQRGAARGGDRARSSARTPTLFELWGGAHLLLGIAGYNFGRFCLTPVPRTDRVRHLRNTIAWIACRRWRGSQSRLLITDDYHWHESVARRQVLRPRTTA